MTNQNVKRLKTKRGLIFLFVAMFLFAITGTALSAIQLEVDFPEIGGEQLTGESTLPQIIKYLLNAFILISLLAVLVSLVYGGITYLTATGNPTAMSKGKQRIFGSLLGLVILLGSYLVLQFVNPQLTILKIKKIPVVSGVLLLNRVAMDPDAPGGNHNPEVLRILKSGTEEEIKETLQTLLEAGPTQPQAIFLRQNSISDCREVFGKLEYPEEGNKEYSNFTNFEIWGVYFLPDSKTKILTFSGANFLNSNGTRAADNEYIYYDCSIGKGACPLKLLEGKSNNFDFTLSTRQPPLSLMVKGVDRGVYLYSDVLGGEVYLQDREYERFLRDRDFDDQTKRIEIRNHMPEDPENDTNYLAILHEDDRFRGNLRIFFEEFFGGQSNVPLFFGGGLWGNLTKDDQATVENESVLDFTKDGIEDIYGKVEKPSSVQIFQMPANKEEWEKWFEEVGGKGCKVKVCVEKGLEGPCHTYDFEAQFLEPIDIVEQGVFKDEQGNEERADLVDNIRSMKIEGSCVVVLFEHSMGHSDFPGKNSEVFTPWSKEYLEQDRAYKDLTPDNHNYPPHKIGYCGCKGENQGFWGIFSPECKPCASSIAIYPVKGVTSSVSPITPSTGNTDWEQCLSSANITKPKEQKEKASPALKSLLNRISGNYPPEPPNCKWWITSISDSAGWERCTEEYESPPCAHEEFSWHYGGTDCHGEASYAVDLVPNDWAESQKLEDAITASNPDFWQLETNRKHFHADVRNACKK